jgi:hydrogenase 3 maturation protease
MKVLLGIGNSLRGDDGVGPWIADHFQADGWLSFNCGTAPENFTSVIRRTAPDLLVLVDAADIGLPAGEFRVVEPSRIEDVSIGTHQLPLTHLVEYLKDTVGVIVFVGIQPGRVVDGEGISVEVRKGAEALMRVLREGSLGEIPSLE